MIENWVADVEIFRANVEAYILKDVEQMRKIMENLVSRSGNKMK